MPFYASNFSYNGTPSETYGIYISDLDPEAISNSMGSMALDIINQKIYRRATPYFYGATPADVLKFNITVNSRGELTAPDFELIQRWLFSSRSYKKLQIFQPDMTDCYFNCIFNDPEIIRVGNLIGGFTAEVQCDSPYAYKYPKTTTYTYTSPVVDNTVMFNNTSDDSGVYLYPSLVITMNTFGGNVTITNISDSNRVFSFTGLSAGEVITMDCGLQTLSSSTGLRRLSSFNKHWLRLVPGKNSIRIQGQVATLAMTTQFVAKKIGG